MNAHLAGCPAGLRLGQGRMRLCIPRAVTAFKSEGASMTLPETDEQRSVRVRISTHFQVGASTAGPQLHCRLPQEPLAAAPVLTLK
jgi:hypothetical protein